MNTNVPKKRGRKSKAELLLLAQNDTKKDNDNNIDNISQKSNDRPSNDQSTSKRGRKPRYVYSAVDESANNDKYVSDDENIIIKLNVNSENTEKDIQKEIKDKLEQPYAYNQDEYNNISDFSKLKEKLENDEEKNDNEDDFDNNSNIESENENNLKIVSLLKDFQAKNKYDEWPTNTSVFCYWCVSQFDNIPFGIPVSYNDNHFYVFGCFCSLECATAYNFNDKNSDIWERYNLINLLSRKLGCGYKVKPAPDRLCLNMFGGYMDINKFREFFKSNKVININMFPMISAVSIQIQEINECEINNDFKYIPLDNDRISNYKKSLLIKRNKPINSNSNSLENYMNLRYA